MHVNIMFHCPYEMTPTVINLDHNKRGFNGYIISSLSPSSSCFNLMNHCFKEAAKSNNLYLSVT